VPVNVEWIFRLNYIFLLSVESKFDHGFDTLIREEVIVRPQNVVIDVTDAIFREINDGLFEISHADSIDPVLVVSTEVVDFDLGLGVLTFVFNPKLHSKGELVEASFDSELSSCLDLGLFA